MEEDWIEKSSSGNAARTAPTAGRTKNAQIMENMKGQLCLQFSFWMRVKPFSVRVWNAMMNLDRVRTIAAHITPQ